MDLDVLTGLSSGQRLLLFTRCSELFGGGHEAGWPAHSDRRVQVGDSGRLPAAVSEAVPYSRRHCHRTGGVFTMRQTPLPSRRHKYPLSGGVTPHRAWPSRRWRIAWARLVARCRLEAQDQVVFDGALCRRGLGAVEPAAAHPDVLHRLDPTLRTLGHQSGPTHRLLMHLPSPSRCPAGPHLIRRSGRTPRWRRRAWRRTRRSACRRRTLVRTTSGRRPGR